MAGMFGEEGNRLERLALLPHPRGMLASEGRGSVMSPGVSWADWIAPQWLAALSQGVQAPRAAYEGSDVDPRDALNVALNAMGAGTAAGTASRGVVANAPVQLRLPLRRAPRKGPTLYHGSTERRKIIPDPDFAVETRGAVFLADNEDVAYTFISPREYGEPVFDAPVGRVTALKADIKKPLILEGAEAQQFIDDTALQGRIVQQAKDAGYDSIIARDVKEGIGERYEGDVYAVFYKGMLSFAKPARPKGE